MGNPYAAKGKKTQPAVQEETSQDENTEYGFSDLSVKNVLIVVGDDVDLAKAALEEEKSGKNRTTLISELEDIING